MTGRIWMAAVAMAIAGCSATPSGDEAAGNNVTLRNLAASEVAVVPQGEDRMKGALIPTPSDRNSRHYLLRTRRAIGGTVVALLREERGDKVAYARAGVDCGRRLFHILGVGSSRARAEVALGQEAALRPMAGLPLREEMGEYICARAGTPLAADAQRG